MKTKVTIPILGDNKDTDFDPANDMMVMVIATTSKGNDEKWKVRVGRKIHKGMGTLATSRGCYGSGYTTNSNAGIVESFDYRKNIGTGCVVMINGIARHVQLPPEYNAPKEYALDYDDSCVDIIAVESEDQITDFSKGNLTYIGGCIINIKNQNFASGSINIIEDAGFINENIFQLAFSPSNSEKEYNDLICLNTNLTCVEGVEVCLKPSLLFISYKVSHTTISNVLTCYLEKYIDKSKKEYYIGCSGIKENKLNASIMLNVGDN